MKRNRDGQHKKAKKQQGDVDGSDDVSESCRTETRVGNEGGGQQYTLTLSGAGGDGGGGER